MMKIFLLFTMSVVCLVSNAQYKKDGTPDMRYKSNKSSYNYSQTYPPTPSRTTYQNGYKKSNGTHVNGHYKTKSNHTNHDNFSTDGNYNPYTRKAGSRAKDYTPKARNYGSGKNIYTGSKGGQYYYNNKGNKVYVPKR